MYEHLSREVFPGHLRWACCTASWRADEKEAAMERFKRGEIEDSGFDHGDRGRRGRAQRHA